MEYKIKEDHYRHMVWEKSWYTIKKLVSHFNSEKCHVLSTILIT